MSTQNVNLKEQKETTYDFLISYRAASGSAYSMPKIHYHSNYEVHFILEGERTLLLDNQIEHLKAGDLLFIRSNDIHRFMARNNTQHSRYMIEFRPEFMIQLMSDSNIDLGHLIDVKSHILRLGGEDRKLINTLFDSLENMMAGLSKSPQKIITHFSEIDDDRRLTYTKALVKLKLAELLIQMSLIGQGKSDAKEREVPSNSLHQKVPMIIDYIHRHYKSSITLDSICESFYMSKSYFCKIFKEVTGTSFIHYLNEVRIKEAKVMLESDGDTVTTIASELGYNSSTHFGRVFKEITGFSPREYRRLVKR